jgi:ubiquinone/menaquinone biosynthesis C-methylase UbiE
MTEKLNIYEKGMLEEVTGRTLRPGGFMLTQEAVLQCRFPAGAAILDIGCGSGATVQFLREKFMLDACGVDITAEMIRRGKCISSDLPLFHGNANDLPFFSSAFDGVFLECSFSLLTDQRAVLAEVNRVLEKNGHLVISDFYYQKGPEKTKEDILEMVRQFGFEVECWQDKSECLYQLVADCIFNGKSIDLLWDCMMAKQENKGYSKEQIKRWKPGYFLLISRKS